MNTETTENMGIGGARRDRRSRYPALEPLLEFLPLMLLCVFAARCLPAWIYMWVIALAMYAWAKWVVVMDLFETEPVDLPRLAVFVVLWPGLNPGKFLRGKAHLPTVRKWFVDTAKMLLGAFVVWFVLRRLPASEPMLIGWVGLVGIAFLLHFGIFHLLSDLWCAAGFNAAPIMINPLAAVSLAEFWGGRWNKAFNDLMRPHFFLPMARSFGRVSAILGVFLISGILHELVISVPACGGYGLPTLYFGIQAAGLLFERCDLGGKLRLGRGWRGWAFTILVTAGPAYWLFHPFFIRNVVLPMLQAMNAI